MFRSIRPILVGLVLFAIGCASMDSSRLLHGRRVTSVRPLRPEIDITSCEHSGGRKDVWITSQVYGSESIQMYLESIDNQTGVVIIAELVGGSDYGSDYEYLACLTREDLAKVGGSGLLTIDVGMIDNGVVKRAYFVDANTFMEMDPMTVYDDIAAVHSSTRRNN